ncbi:helix-turn-helix transcriptional regulator [Pigmentiphaga aceris]|uniref:Helix-turn-helix transcriptional regulator n=1 Tax=Pigmentiphaga aceris TaxID=1940612 RepID=A0A5C0B226_9BURK|nr:helix-turn-helix transcriptional regulator [Pigmentiphaga aceris]QEI07773.1 helix-turn-helix transcriptional regulator [Pigmentiphaga aceris]
MPRTLRQSDAVATQIAERLREWGACIRTQRVAQHIRASDLCARMEISLPTLRRIEQGDPGASAASYLNALLILGVFNVAAPSLPAEYSAGSPSARVPGGIEEDDYF